MPLRYQSGGLDGSGVASHGGQQPASAGKAGYKFGSNKVCVPRLVGGKSKNVRPVHPGKTLAAAALSSHGGKMGPPPVKKKQKKLAPGTVALREIRRFQKSTDTLTRFAPFARLVREIEGDVFSHQPSKRWEKQALLALQEAAEAHLVKWLEKSNLVAIHAGRGTVMSKDMQLVGTMADKPF